MILTEKCGEFIGDEGGEDSFFYSSTNNKLKTLTGGEQGHHCIYRWHKHLSQPQSCDDKS